MDFRSHLNSIQITNITSNLESPTKISATQKSIEPIVILRGDHIVRTAANLQCAGALGLVGIPNQFISRSDVPYT